MTNTAEIRQPTSGTSTEDIDGRAGGFKVIWAHFSYLGSITGNIREEALWCAIGGGNFENPTATGGDPIQ